MNNWQEVQVSDVYEALYDGPHATPQPSEEGPIFLSIANLSTTGELDLTTTKHISNEEYPRWTKRVTPKPNDIVFTYEASLHRYGVIPNNFHGCLGRRLALIRPNNSKAFYKYLFYYFLSSAWKKEVSNYILAGTTVDRIPLTKFPSFKLRVPDLTKQKKIAAILSTYDELIEINKRRITILEQMAEEIYREWFIRMRFPGYKKTCFKKGLPEKWELTKIRDIVEYYIGGGWGEEIQNLEYHSPAYVIRGTDIPSLNNGDFSKDIYRYHKASNLKSRKLQSGDFVFEVSGGSKNQLLGRNLLITKSLLDYFEQNVMCASFCKQIRFKTSKVSPFLMKFYLKLYYECGLVGIYQVQSTGISNYHFESFLDFQTIVLPPKDLQDKFDELIEPILSEKDNLSLANESLVKTKNMLLSRLISGKLSVENLDIQFPPGMMES